MPECTDRNLSDLIYAYDLDALSEEDCERFEIHILECEHCFEEVQKFKREASLLRKDDDVREVIREAAAAHSKSESISGRLLSYLWPQAPMVFKPALVYLVILMMIVPAYLGLKTIREDRIQPVQTIFLYPDRSTEEMVLNKSTGGDGLISFVYSGAVPSEHYQVLIETEDGQTIFLDENFTGFDDFEMGRLMLAIDKMEPGRYRLIITDLYHEPPLEKQEYRFRLDE